MRVKDKWKPLIDDISPRHVNIKSNFKEIREYKIWTMKGSVIKVIEELAPITARLIFERLVDVHMVSNDDKGLQSVRKAISQLNRDGTIQFDVSERKIIAQEYSTEGLIILNPERKYKFK